MTATHRVLKVLAAITWYAGSIVLASKGTSLVMEAHAQRPGQRWPWLVLAVGLLAGAVKAGCFFARICIRSTVGPGIGSAVAYHALSCDGQK